MRMTCALCLLLLSGCASAVQQPEHSILRPRPKVLYVNGTLEPMTFAMNRSTYAISKEGREPCETNDPMATALSPLPPSAMPTSRPLRVAAMPNYCPVTRPASSKTVFTRAPHPPKVAPAPAPTEPQP
jgi:hypothetical protein